MEEEKKEKKPYKKHPRRHYNNQAKPQQKKHEPQSDTAAAAKPSPEQNPTETKPAVSPRSAEHPQPNANGGNNGNRRRNHHNKNKKKPPAQIQPDNDIFDTAEEMIPEGLSVEDITENVFEEATPEKAPEPQKSSVMVEVIGIRFKPSGKTYYFDPSGITLKKNMHAIVETARGLEFGDVSLANTFVSESDIVPPLRPVVRIATEADVQHNKENKQKEQDAFVKCNERIIAHGLDMKLIEAQYTFDNSKLLFYFTSAGRVDFRELVKDLASVFRTRIELRQIGIRDEAKLIGGLGMCGRPLCCSLFLNDFAQVSIKMAKEQNLSLNFTKISGACGRLMCCLRYEHDTYEEEIKKTPPVDSTVKTEDGIGTVTEINPLAGTIKVRLNDKPDTPPKSYHRNNVTVLQQKVNKDS